MSGTVTVSVTQKHIEVGIEGNCRKCPVALVIGELLNEGFFVEVGSSELHIFNKVKFSRFCIIKMPAIARELVNCFDSTGSATPITFELPRDSFLPGMLREGV